VPPKLTRLQRAKKTRVGADDLAGLVDDFDAFGAVFGDEGDPIFSRSPVELGRLNDGDFDNIGDVIGGANDDLDKQMADLEMTEIMLLLEKNRVDLEGLKIDLDLNKEEYEAMRLEHDLKGDLTNLDKEIKTVEEVLLATDRAIAIERAKKASERSGLWWIAGGVVAIVLLADSTRGMRKKGG
jgi:hypothetical protein